MIDERPKVPLWDHLIVIAVGVIFLFFCFKGLIDFIWMAFHLH